MTIQPTEYERPTWREVNIDLLAQRMYHAHTSSTWGATFDLDTTSPENRAAWTAAAEAAVEMIVDEPEKEFHENLQAILTKFGTPVTESKAAREWREAKASDWIA